MLAVGFGNVLSGGLVDRPDPYTRIFDLDSGHQLAELSGHLGGVMGVAFSPGRERLATVGVEGKPVIWRMGSGEPLMSIDAHRRGAFWVSFSPNGGLIATAGGEGKVHLWNGRLPHGCARSRCRRKRSWGSHAALTGGAWLPRRLCCGSVFSKFSPRAAPVHED